MAQRSHLARIEKLEQIAERCAEELSRSFEDCICFPETEQPSFDFPIEEEITFRVKCPLHGARFKSPQFHIFVSKWMREKKPSFKQRLSAQHQKAWTASFPPDLWLAEEVETSEGIYLRLKDGTLLPEYAFPLADGSRDLIRSAADLETKSRRSRLSLCWGESV